jgi:hypothetical protein
MKVESNIRVGQLVRIKNAPPRDRGLYLVTTVHGQNNIEILSVDGNNKQPRRRWWVAEGLSVYA